jgi:transcriptional regulator with XRE-family HTH domain
MPAGEYDEVPGLRKLVGQQVRRLRLHHEWDQQELADALDAVGHPIDRSGIAKIESATRNVTLEDFVALAAALGVEPAGLIAPRDDNVEVAVVPGLVRTGAQIRAWLHGFAPLYPYAENETAVDRVYEQSLSDQEWRARRRPIVLGLRGFLLYIEELAAGDDEAALRHAVALLGEFVARELQGIDGDLFSRWEE